MPRTSKPMGGCVPCPAMKAWRLGKVTSFSGRPERKLMDEDVSVKPVSARRAVAVDSWKAERREPTIGDVSLD